MLCAALVWGVAFAFQADASSSIGSLSFTAGKSALAALTLSVVVMIRSAAKRKAKAERTETAAEQAIAEYREDSPKALILAGIACGVALCFADNLQQLGITAYPPDAAASGRSGFLTATYVIMVALVSPFLGKKLHPVVVAASGVCVLGMYLLCLSGGLEGIYLGDAYCLLCAAFYTVHLLVIDRYTHLDPVKLTMLQFVVSALISGVLAAIIEHPDPATYQGVFWQVFYVGVISSAVGYTFQTIGQRYADPAVAAIVLSLESVFAALAGVIMLGEAMAGRELLGCVLMFAAVLLAQVPDLVKSRRKA